MRRLGLTLSLLFVTVLGTATFNVGMVAGCTGTPVGPDLASVQAAVQAATSGQTICVNGGTVTWNGGLSTQLNNKYITLKGAGAGTPAQCAVPGQTTYTCITRGTVATRTIQWTTVDSPAGTVSRISGFTFRGRPGTSVNQRGDVFISGDSGRFRLDHVYFEIIDSPVLNVNGYVRGVVDHVSFDNANVATGTTTFTTSHAKWLGDPDSNGNRSWASPLTFGTAEALYFEDNIILPSTLSAGDGERGGRSVYRFSTYNNVIISSGHGTETLNRGYMQHETYGNTINWSISTTPLIGGRAGTHIVFNNRLVTNLVAANLIEAAQYFRFTFPTVAIPFGAALVRPITSITWSGGVATVTTTGPLNHRFIVNGWARIRNSPVSAYNSPASAPWKITSVPTPTTFTFPLAANPGNDSSGLAIAQSPYDADTAPTLSGKHGFGAYPGIDMNCWGPGHPLRRGGSAGAVPFGFPNQTLVGCLAWGNLRGSPTPNILVPSYNNSGLLVQANREMWNQNTSVECTTPSGGVCSTGIGVGPIANKPLQCSPTNGVGPFYWATDQGNWRTKYSSQDGGLEGTPFPANESGKLYRCTATNTWTPYYGPNNSTGEPLTYPHPLTLLP
jgi:hypothetical protein